MSSDILCGETPHSCINAFRFSAGDRALSVAVAKTGVDVELIPELVLESNRKSGLERELEETTLLSYTNMSKIYR